MSGSKAGMSAAGAVVAALLASACCVGPVVLAFAGLGGAASAFLLAPYRPYLLGLSFGLLGVAFFFTYRRPRAACGPEDPCRIAPAARGRKVLLWLAALAVVLMSFSPPRAAWRPPPMKDRPARVAVDAPSGGATARLTTIMTIGGMTCGGCVARVEDRLGHVPGVAAFDVSLENNEARVSYDPAAVTPEAIAAAVSETGFAAAVKDHTAP
jgi:mercuric ion transport protein